MGANSEEQRFLGCVRPTPEKWPLDRPAEENETCVFFEEIISLAHV